MLSDSDIATPYPKKRPVRRDSGKKSETPSFKQKNKDYESENIKLRQEVLRCKSERDGIQEELNILQKKYTDLKKLWKKLDMERFDGLISRFEDVLDRTSVPIAGKLKIEPNNSSPSTIDTTANLSERPLRNNPPKDVDGDLVVWFKPEKRGKGEVKDEEMSSNLKVLGSEVGQLNFIREKDGSCSKQLSQMREEGRKLLTNLADHNKCFAPSWKKVRDPVVRDHFYATMEAKFPALRLCQGHWKADALAIDIYSHWKRKYSGTAVSLAKNSPRKRKVPVSSSDNGSSTKRPRLQIDLTTESESPITEVTDLSPTSATLPEVRPDTETLGAPPLAPKPLANISTEPFKSQRFSAAKPAATHSSSCSVTSHSTTPSSNLTTTANSAAAAGPNPHPTPSESTAPIDENIGVRTTPIENTKDDIPSNASNSGHLNCSPPDLNIDPMLLQESTTAHTQPPALPETSPNTSSTPPDISPELQAAIDATKKNQALWLGTMRLNKYQDRAPRFRNDNSAEHLCGHEWKKTHEGTKTREFVAYWNGLSDLEKYEWFKRSDDTKEEALRNSGKKMIPKNTNM